MDDDEQVLVEGPDHAFAKAAQADDAPPFAAVTGGVTDRSRKGLTTRTRSSVCPTIRGPRA